VVRRVEDFLGVKMKFQNESKEKDANRSKVLVYLALHEKNKAYGNQ